MLGLIGAILAVGISLCWYLPALHAQGDRRVLKKNDYWRAAIVYGFCYTSLLIIITEILWDVLADRIGLSGIKRDILADFFRAALLEELFKFTGFLLAKRALKLRRKIDYIMIAGLIGLVYGVVEKAVLGNPAGVIIGLAIPMHITWQFNQGGHWFEYEEAKARNDRPKMQREMLMAVVLPFVFHGCWDSGLDLTLWLIEQESVTPQVIGGIMSLALIVLGVVYTIRTSKKVCAIARTAEPAVSDQDQPEPQIG